jgi:hypothetical protein
VTTTNIQRNRFYVAIGVLLVIALGLASRKFPFLFPAFLGKYPGDALWALTVFLVWAFFKPNATTLALALLGLATSYADEFSQLYQAPWINAIRRTTVGHLLLGSTFSWFDMCAYTVGVAVGVALDLLIFPALARQTKAAATPTPSSPS